MTHLAGLWCKLGAVIYLPMHFFVGCLLKPFLQEQLY